MGAIQSLIFDFDGTLADTLPICIEAFRRAALPYQGRLLSDEEIRSTFGPSEEGSAAVLAPGHEEECLESYLAHYCELHSSCKAPFPGVVSLLDWVESKGILLAMVTGKGARSLEISLKFIGLADRFEEVESGCPHGPCKPAGIRSILERRRLDPSRVWYVGDSPWDVRSAREAGVFVCGVGWGANSHLEQLRAADPDQLFMTVEDCATWLSGSSA